MKSKSIFASFLFIIIAFVFLNCSSHGTTNVKIHINLGLNNAGAVNIFENSIFDKIFRLFTKDAEAQSAPSHINSIILNISGSGMDAIHQTYSKPNIPDSISLDVESGPSRLFEVLAYTASATLRGAVTQSLVGGTTVTIPITMGLYETKIVIPDTINFGGTPRVVQIDDITDTSLQQCLSVTGISTFRPNDIDFDSQGRIYIANNWPSTGGDVIGRIDTINGDNPFTFGGNGSGYVAIAIDRINRINNYNIVYCARDGVNTLWRYTTNGTLISQVTLTGITFNAIRGLAVDDSGNLYIAATTSTGLPRVIKCTPGNPSTNVIPYSASLNTPWDVVVKDNYLYVANFDGAAGYKILQLDLNLNLLGNIGNQSPSADSVPGNFYGPKRFLAILNRGFYLIDEASANDKGFMGDRLVYFNDISLSGWQTATTLGIDFWWQC